MLIGDKTEFHPDRVTKDPPEEWLKNGHAFVAAHLETQSVKREGTEYVWKLGYVDQSERLSGIRDGNSLNTPEGVWNTFWQMFMWRNAVAYDALFALFPDVQTVRVEMVVPGGTPYSITIPRGDMTEAQNQIDQWAQAVPQLEGLRDYQ